MNPDEPKLPTGRRVMTPDWKNRSLRGVLDIHVHAAPDTRPRWHTALELARLASASGMAGFVIKNHDRPTAEEAGAARRSCPDLHVYGGITLNRSAGGLNPVRVAAALEQGARVVWFPTKDGAGERPANPLAVIDAKGELLPETRRIIEQIAAADAVLATGHIAAEEVTAVLRAARQMGVRRLVVNHPEIPFLNFNTALQREWRDCGAMLERCFPRPEAVDGFDQIARDTRAAGVDSTILASDLGRRDLPSPLEGLRRLIHEMAARGFTESDLALMTHHNPLRLLGAGNFPSHPPG